MLTTTAIRYQFINKSSKPSRMQIQDNISTDVRLYVYRYCLLTKALRINDKLRLIDSDVSHY